MYNEQENRTLPSHYFDQTIRRCYAFCTLISTQKQCSRKRYFMYFQTNIYIYIYIYISYKYIYVSYMYI